MCKFARIRTPLILLLPTGGKDDNPVFGLIALFRMRYCLASGTGEGVPRTKYHVGGNL